MNITWSLYNNEEKLRIDDLKTEHVRIILLAISAARIKDWSVYRYSESRWEPLAEAPEFRENIEALMGPGVLPPPRKPLTPPLLTAPRAKASLSLSAQARGNGAASETKKTRTLGGKGRAAGRARGGNATGAATPRQRVVSKERRSARRYPRQLKFHAFIEGQNFECDTLDISLTGAALAARLPGWLPKTFRATLRLKETLVLVMCARVSDNHNKIKILESDSWDVIRQWMVNW